MWNQLVLHWDSAMIMLSSTMLENVDLHPTGCSKYTACNGPMSCQWIWFPVPCNSGQLVSCQLCAFSLKPRKDSISRRRACNSVPGFLAWRKKNCLKSSTAGQIWKGLKRSGGLVLERWRLKVPSFCWVTCEVNTTLIVQARNKVSKVQDLMIPDLLQGWDFTHYDS